MSNWSLLEPAWTRGEVQTGAVATCNERLEIAGQRQGLTSGLEEYAAWSDSCNATSIECLASSDHLSSPLFIQYLFHLQCILRLQTGPCTSTRNKGHTALALKGSLCAGGRAYSFAIWAKGASVPRARLFEYSESWNQSNEVQLIN